MSAETLYRRAYALHQQGNLAEAEKLCRRLLARDAGLADAAYLLAMILAQSGRLDAALDAVGGTVAAGGETASLLALSGYLLQAAGRLEEAVAACDRSLALDAGQAETWNNRGAALQSLGRLETALESFDAALARAPGHGGALYNRATALLEMNRLGEAVAGFDQVVVRMPNYAEAWNNRGIALQRLDQLEAALADFSRAIAFDPGHAEALFNRGVVLEEMHRSKEALASLERSLAVRPDHAEAWVKRGVSLQRLKRFDEALASYDRALVLRPDYAEALKQSASALCESGRIADGFAIYDRHAALSVGKAKTSTAPAHKQLHDAQQRAYIVEQTARDVDVDGALHLADGGRVAGDAIRRDHGCAVAEHWASSRPQIVVIDDLLTPQAFDKLRRFCLESTVWRRAYDGGYLGALPEQGFACPLLAQVAEELRAAYPAIFAGHPLHYMWGFKYDSTLSGIALHADKAAVNVNFWLTPDESNLDPDSGGLVVWDAAAPPDWDFRRYNGDTQACRDFLECAGAKPVKIPYRCNRAVIFDSDLFHETDAIRFRDGYQNRRINITLLYGRRTAENR
jgi:tetratricopeptide (TPR) repeat protein